MSESWCIILSVESINVVGVLGTFLCSESFYVHIIKHYSPLAALSGVVAEGLKLISTYLYSLV